MRTTSLMRWQSVPPGLLPCRERSPDAIIAVHPGVVDTPPTREHLLRGKPALMRPFFNQVRARGGPLDNMDWICKARPALAPAG